MREMFELFYSVRLLLDDSRDWYFPDIIYALNKAQYQLIQQHYFLHNELFLRPFYRYDYNLIPGDVIQEADIITKVRSDGDGVLYPRIAQLYFINDTSPAPIDDYKIPCEYLEAQQFLLRKQQSEIRNPQFTPVLDGAFRDVAYTVIDNKIYYDYPHSYTRIEIFYIKKPRIINVILDNNNRVISYTAPEVEEMFIPQLVGLTAEILNTKDVLETQRGDIFNVYQGDKKLTLQNVMELIGGSNG